MCWLESGGQILRIKWQQTVHEFKSIWIDLSLLEF